MRRLSIVKELLLSLVERKKFFLAPLVIILVLMIVFILLAEIPALTPFIYAIF